MSYVVLHHSRIDCYKRAETFTETLYSGIDEMSAYNTAANQWLSLMKDQIEDDPDITATKALKEFLENEPDAIEIHEYFEENASEIWSTEYILEPREEVEVQTSTNPDSLVDLNQDLLQEVLEINNEGLDLNE